MAETISAFSGKHAFLSNFAAARFQFTDGITYPTAEHAFQAQKTALIADRLRLATLPTAQDAKAYGRGVTLIEGWDTVRKRVMHEVVLAKFWELPELAAQLEATGDALLTEGNKWHDNYWGDCRCRNRMACDGPGLNHLGRILVSVRDLIRED